MSPNLDAAFAIFEMDPLPDDAEEQLERLANDEPDMEIRESILSMLEAVFVQRNKPANN